MRVESGELSTARPLRPDRVFPRAFCELVEIPARNRRHWFDGDGLAALAAERASRENRPILTPAPIMNSTDLQWKPDLADVDWDALSHLYRIAPLGEKKPEDLRISFGNSRYTCLVFDGATLVGAGRALADGIDCSYICDVAVHPDYQGIGLGKARIERLRDLSAGHR
jgi:ribosomal protein S18 acetylase RimI-like enzyme